MDLNLHPELKEPLKALCSDPSTTIVVLSRSSRSVLDKVCIYFLTLVSFLGIQASLTDLVFTQNQNFGEYDMWLAAENGMFLRLTNGEWMTTMPEHLNMEWVDSVKVQRYLVQTKPNHNLSSGFFYLQRVLKYFTERTPRSHFETRDTSLIWNYKYAGNLSISLFLVIFSSGRLFWISGCGFQNPFRNHQFFFLLGSVHTFSIQVGLDSKTRNWLIPGTGSIILGNLDKNLGCFGLFRLILDNTVS